MNKEIISNYYFVIKQISYKENKKHVDEANLGKLWNVLNPFFYMVILSLYYENIIIHDIPKFPVFAFVGVLLFNYYKSSTVGAMKSIVNSKNLLIKSKVPIIVFILQKIFYGFKEFLFGTIALIPVLIFFHVQITPRIVEIIPVLLITTVIITSIGVILAIEFVNFSDIEYLYTVFMSLMIFISGVFIPLNHLPERLQFIMRYNPIFLTIYIFRNALIYDLPSHWTAWIKLILWAIFFGVLAYRIYDKNIDSCVNRL